MKLHEYQARDLLAANGVAVTGGRVAKTPAEARQIADELGGKVVVKAQIHAGGRGKGRLVAESETAAMFEKLTTDPANNSGQVKGDRVGGVRLADTAAEAEAAAAAILGKHLVSIQTGPEGKLVKTVLVAEQTDIVKEYYLSVLVESSANGHLFIASAEGGQEIEHVAATNPDAIARIAVNSASGWEGYVGRTLAQRLGFSGDQATQFATLAEALYKTACATDASLVEINPLAVTAEGRVVAVDAKLTIDDNAMYRHKDLAELRDKDEEDPLEVMAQEMGVSNFIKLEGNIGCIVNGAGLAMATMDAIKFAGGEPANFLDIGTVNDPQRVVSALQVIIKDPSVKAILVNIFGGMARVDIIAQGVIDGFKQLGIEVPVVMRLVGTNLAEGEQLLAASGIPAIRATDFGDAAAKAVEAANKAA
ncbi:MAG: ADP-forming succinate--CoA ligase subunit beta [Dehalococcoidia bacterium]